MSPIDYDGNLELAMMNGNLCLLESNVFFYVEYLGGKTFITEDVFFPLNFNVIAKHFGYYLEQDGDVNAQFIEKVFNFGNLYLENLKTLLYNPCIYGENVTDQLQI